MSTLLIFIIVLFIFNIFDVTILFFSKSKKKDPLETFQLKLNKFDITLNSIFIIFGFSIIIASITYVFFNSSNISEPSKFTRIFSSLIFLFLFILVFLDVFIFITHLIHENKQIIYLDNLNKKLTAVKKENKITFDLNSKSLRIVEFQPSQHNYKLPGSTYSYLILIDKEKKILISNMIYDHYDFYFELLKNPNFRIFQNQLNYIRND
ncbi:membrane hypothetical protein [uncultured Paludibacter sp.]|uniref:PH domain-containing protein n=1 Tax=uncultured Paludibacter sp. TaxID=497635 RepID=A0A653AJP7_9BACT|nr:membrane hypothetical protein [uncultured Paludibacter sp.]